MHELIIRCITSLALISLGIAIYAYMPPLAISCILFMALCYCLFCEYKPLYKPQYKNSYISLALIIGGFSALIWLNHVHRFSLALPFIIAMLADTGGYSIGNLFGKHRIAPNISPKKTWEGLLGSCIFLSIGICALTYYCAPSVWEKTDIPSTIVFLVVCAVVALLGDLCISQLKRNAGAKDTGSLLPGHGGLLDRFDSILAIAIFLLIMQTFMHP